MTTTNSTDDRVRGRDAIFRCLSGSRRRIVLGFLLERAPEWTETDAVAEHLAIAEYGSDDVISERVKTARVALVHSTLPALADAGLIERDRSTGGVRLESDLPVDTPTAHHLISSAVQANETFPDEVLDRVFDAVADTRRRAILSELDRRSRSISCESLARAVAARERDVTSEAVDIERVERVQTTLVHTHLPMLSAAGLIEFDAEAGSVRPVGHPQVDAELLDPGLELIAPFA